MQVGVGDVGLDQSFKQISERWVWRHPALTNPNSSLMLPFFSPHPQTRSRKPQCRQPHRNSKSTATKEWLPQCWALFRTSRGKRKKRLPLGEERNAARIVSLKTQSEGGLAPVL